MERGKQYMGSRDRQPQGQAGRRPGPLSNPGQRPQSYRNPSPQTRQEVRPQAHPGPRPAYRPQVAPQRDPAYRPQAYGASPARPAPYQEAEKYYSAPYQSYQGQENNYQNQENYYQNNSYQDNSYHNNYYQDDYDQDTYYQPRNTLGGDPYEHLTQPPSWTKWIAPVLSGIVFIACLIILLTLLS